MKNHSLKWKLQNKFVITLTIICAISLVLVGILTVLLFNRNDKPQISSNIVSERLSEISELATMQLQYRDISHFEEGNVTYLTKKSFNMVYDATVKVGVNLTDVIVEIKHDTIQITLPPAEIFDITIDPNTIEFYDERYALFNWQEKQDTVEVLKQAQSDVTQMVADRNIYQQATEQAKILIEGILSPLLDEQSSIEFIQLEHKQTPSEIPENSSSLPNT